MAMRLNKLILKRAFFCALLLPILSSHNAFSNSRTFEEFQSLHTHCQENKESSHLKLDYSQKTEEKNQFLVGWKLKENQDYYHRQKPEIGGNILIVRCLPPGRYAVIAEGIVNRLNGKMIEASVIANNYDEIVLGKYTQNLVESGNLFTRPMVGDEVFSVNKSIQKKLVINPTFRLENNSLFTKQNEGGYSLDLSEKGQNLLREKFAQLKDKNGRLLVGGYALITGNREDIRTESLMRAQTVSTFLIREFALDPSQVVPLGYGNDWMQSGMEAVGKDYSGRAEEGIVLKMLAE